MFRRRAASSAPATGRHPALRIRALCIKVVAARLLGQTPTQSATAAQAESLARGLGDPALLSQALTTRAHEEASDGRRQVAVALADEALAWARAAGDEWEIACAARARAAAAATAPELRERVDRAGRLLNDVGNTYQLVHMLSSAARRALSMGSDVDARDFVDRAIPLAGGLDDPVAWMNVRGSLGLTALLTGEPHAAEDALRDELRLCRELALRPVASTDLLGMAAIAASRGELQRAARLAGAGAAHRHGQPEHPLDARLHATFLQSARTRCGADAWDAAAREGAALSLADTINDALEEPRA